MTMDAQDVLDVFTVLTSAGVSPTLEGGWGVEALLGGQYRDHRDVDLVVDQQELPAAVDALALAGFEVIDGDSTDATVRLGDEHERVIDLRTVTTDRAGNGWIPTRADFGEPDFPAESFTYGWVAGKRLACISPNLQAARHSGYPLSDDEIDDVHRLRERFSVPLPPELR